MRVIIDKFYVTDLYTFMFGRRYNYERRLTNIKRVLPILLLMASCSSGPVLDSKKTEHRLEGYDTNLKVVRIENCEYFVGGSGYGSVFTHKGNCSNPIHTKLIK